MIFLHLSLIHLINLRYADHTVLTVENEEDLKQLLGIVEEESSNKGFELNSKKTEVMVINQNKECPEINIFIKGNKFKHSDQFKCLGTVISSDGCNSTEIASRIAQAKKSFQKIKSVRTNNHILIHTRRKRALESIVNPF